VLCPDNASANHFTRILRDAGLSTINLEFYNGVPTSAIKIGTFARSKGIEFKHVFLPDYDRARRRATIGGHADVDRLQQADNELYVAMIRARDTLWLGALTRRAT
jgi:superfamily I DNA/RNA helicase